MKPIVKEIFEKIDDYAPFFIAEDWDNSGLLVGNKESAVERILVALDLDEEVLSLAVKDHIDLIVTHHPVIFHSIKSVTGSDFIGRRLMTLIKNDISVISAHTNYDIAIMGRIAASKLALKNVSPLEVTGEIDGEPAGIGVVGDVEPTELKTVTFSTKIGFDLDAVRVYGSDRKVRKIAICPGSGGGNVERAVKAGADVYITGDVSHHTGIDAVASGMAVIDAGHAGLEHVFVPDMAAMLRLSFPAVYVDTLEKISPFETV